MKKSTPITIWVVRIAAVLSFLIAVPTLLFHSMNGAWVQAEVNYTTMYADLILLWWLNRIARAERELENLKANSPATWR